MEQNQPQPPVFNPQPQPALPMPQYQPRVVARPLVSFMTAVKTCFTKYCVFKGRARRSEYWWFVLFYALVSFLMSTLFMAISPRLVNVGSLAVKLLMLLPMCSVLARRLHDTGHGGWMAVVFAITVIVYFSASTYLMWQIQDQLITDGNMMQMVGIIADAFNENPISATVMSFSCLPMLIFGLITLIFSLLDGKPEDNKYGPSPKYYYQ